MTQETNIVVNCPDCGDLRVPPEAVTVRTCVDDGNWSYRFTCPSCGRATAGKSVMKALMNAVDAGAGYEAWTMPTDLDARPGGPLFTPEDVLDLHLLLLEPNWFDDLCRCELDAER